MEVNSCFQLGYIKKTHGLNGEVTLILDTDNPENYNELESVFLQISGKLIPFFVEYLQLKGKSAIVAFEDIETIEEATELVGSSVFLPLDLLPALPEDKFYYHEVIGYQTFDKIAGEIGVIEDVFTSSGNDLLKINSNGHEVLIPIEDEFIEKVDKENKRIIFNLPDGLLDLYLK